MYKVMTPAQLKEHNTMLLLLKEKEKEKEDKEKEDMGERECSIDDMLSKKELLETIPELEHEIEELESGLENIGKEIETINNGLEGVGKEIASTKNDILVIKNNISTSEKKLSDKIEQEIDGVYKTTSEIKNELNSLKDNDRKPKVERIIEKVELPKDLARLSDIPSLEEYAKTEEIYTKKETYNKQEVYNKREIDSKLQSTGGGKRYSEIKDDITDGYFTRSSEKISEKSLPSGGASGSILTKHSSADYDAAWATPTEAGIVIERGVILGTLSDQTDLQTALDNKEDSLTFSTGLTRVTDTVTSDLSTGVSGGQSVVGGTGSGENITISSTSHVTKGNINFGTSTYDEANNRLGINNTTPTAPVDITNESDGGAIGSEQITATNNRTFSGTPPNRSGTGRSRVSNRRSHTVGANPTVLDNAGLASSPVAGVAYQIGYNVTTTTAGVLTMSFGGTDQYVSQGSVVMSATSFVELIVATDSSPLTFTPDATRVGSIDSITIKIVTPRTTPTVNYRNTSGDVTTSLRSNGDIAGGGFPSFALGDGLGYFSTSPGTIAIGASAFKNATTASGIAIGQQALSNNVTGSSNLAIGNSTLSQLTNGTSNTAISNSSLGLVIGGSNNVGIGPYSGGNILYGSNNTAIGYYALPNSTTGSNNTAIGYNAGTGMTEGSNNTIIGNNIAFPYDTGSNQLNIANMIYGSNMTGTGIDVPTDGAIGIGQPAPTATLHLRGGTDVTGTAPLKIDTGTLLTTPEDGAFEFDGTNLYFTIGGVRKQFVMV